MNIVSHDVSRFSACVVLVRMKLVFQLVGLAVSDGRMES